MPVNRDKPAAHTEQFGQKGGSGSPVLSAGSDLAVVVLDNAEELEAHKAEWQVLADAALEPNVFYEPCCLPPSLRAFGAHSELRLVLVYASALATEQGGVGAEGANGARAVGQGQLVGFFPLERARPNRRLPVPHLRMWVNDYSYVSTPLVHSKHAAAVVSAFFRWLEGQSLGSRLVFFEHLPVGGPVQALLAAEAERPRRTGYVRERFHRALLAPDCEAEAYRQRALSRREQKSFERRRRRLAELGSFEIATLTAAEEVDAWCEAYLALENAGWKGHNGTAFASNPRDTVFFRTMFRQAFAAGRLSSTAVVSNGQKIAIQILLHAGRGAYAYKTTYDESFSSFGPGALLEFDLIGRTGFHAPIGWVDSAADPENALLNRMWTERRMIENWLVTCDDSLGLLLSLMPALRWVKRNFRGARLPQ